MYTLNSQIDDVKKQVLEVGTNLINWANREREDGYESEQEEDAPMRLEKDVVAGGENEEEEPVGRWDALLIVALGVDEERGEAMRENVDTATGADTAGSINERREAMSKEICATAEGRGNEGAGEIKRDDDPVEAVAFAGREQQNEMEEPMRVFEDNAAAAATRKLQKLLEEEKDEKKKFVIASLLLTTIDKGKWHQLRYDYYHGH